MKKIFSIIVIGVVLILLIECSKVNSYYEHAGSFSEGKAAVMINDKWSFIDKNGKAIF